jgi:hypothetical protein
MKRTVVYVLICAGLALCPSAWASWSNFASTGNATGIGSPSCAFVPSGKAVCAVRSGKSAMMVNEFNGTSWGTWTSLSGSVASNPSCTSNGSGDVICAGTGHGATLFGAELCRTHRGTSTVCRAQFVGWAHLLDLQRNVLERFQEDHDRRGLGPRLRDR